MITEGANSVCQLQINEGRKQLQKDNSLKVERQFANTTCTCFMWVSLATYNIQMKLKGKELTVQKTKQYPFYFWNFGEMFPYAIPFLKKKN